MIRKLRPNNEKGFTLIELMIVVAIIGILAAIAIPQFASYRESSYIASMKADCNSIRVAEEAYFVDKDTYIIGDPTATLVNYGIKSLSTGNTGVVSAGTAADIAKGFDVTVTSTKTTKKVVYDSALGTTVTS